MVPYALTAYPQYFPRTNFRGLTDKYGQYNSRFGTTQTDLLQKAIRGDSPFDVYGGLIDVDYRDTAVERLERYRWEWRWYRGEHYDNPFEENEYKSKTNYCKVIVDKSVNFFTASSWTCKTVEGNEQIAQVLNDCWNKNNRPILTQKALQFMGINGDAYMIAMVCTKDPQGRPLKRKNWYISIKVIDPKYVFPFFAQSDTSEMESVLIQYPATPPDFNTEQMLYSMLVTPETIFIYNNETLVQEVPNPFGRLNVVKIKNKEVANSSFGESDLQEIIALNDEINVLSNSIRRTLKYHSEPTTLVFGARLSDMERGAKKIWSNLPETAKVENLELKGDLASSLARLEWIEQRILALGEIPKVLLDLEKSPRISNTSGIALQMMFQPIIDKTSRKQKWFSKAVIELNQLILIGSEQILKKNIADLADNLDALYDSEVEYSSPLPRDRAAEIDSGIKLVEAGAWSLAEFIRNVADVDDTERLSAELAADRWAELAMAFENQNAVNGIRPNVLAALQGSTGMSEDLSSLQTQLAAALKKAKPPKKPLQIPMPRIPKLRVQIKAKPSGNKPATKAAAKKVSTKAPAKKPIAKPVAKKPKLRVRTK